MFQFSRASFIEYSCINFEGRHWLPWKPGLLHPRMLASLSHPIIAILPLSMVSFLPLRPFLEAGVGLSLGLQMDTIVCWWIFFHPPPSVKVLAWIWVPNQDCGLSHCKLLIKPPQAQLHYLWYVILSPCCFLFSPKSPKALFLVVFSNKFMMKFQSMVQ